MQWAAWENQPPADLVVEPGEIHLVRPLVLPETLQQHRHLKAMMAAAARCSCSYEWHLEEVAARVRSATMACSEHLEVQAGMEPQARFQESARHMQAAAVADTAGTRRPEHRFLVVQEVQAAAVAVQEMGSDL
jgi:hypothetical protein